MKSLIIVSKTYLPATNGADIQGLFLLAEQQNINLPAEHLPEGIYTGLVANVLNYIQPYIWEDQQGKHLKLTLSCSLVNHRTGEVHGFGLGPDKISLFHIGKDECLKLRQACTFQVTLNKQGFIAKFIVDDESAESGIKDAI